MNTIAPLLALFFLSISGTLSLAGSLNPPVLSVKIEFGRGPHCDGRGTCAIDEMEAENANAKFFFDDLGRLHMALKKNAFPESELEQQFENDLFYVPDDFPIEYELMQKLQKDAAYLIQAGAYPMNENSSWFEVIFQN